MAVTGMSPMMRSRILLAESAPALLTCVLAACSQIPQGHTGDKWPMGTQRPEGPAFQEPPSDLPMDQHGDEPIEDVRMPYSDQEDAPMPASEIERVKQTHEQSLLAIEGVVGVGITANEIGDDAIAIYLRAADAAGRIPNELDGFPVITEVSGEFEAFDASGGP